MEKGGRLSAARRAGGLDEREAETTRAIHLRTTDAHARRSLAGNLALGEGSAEAWAGPSGDEGRERKGRVSMGTLATKRLGDIRRYPCNLAELCRFIVADRELWSGAQPERAREFRAHAVGWTSGGGCDSVDDAAREWTALRGYRAGAHLSRCNCSWAGCHRDGIHQCRQPDVRPGRAGLLR